MITRQLCISQAAASPASKVSAITATDSEHIQPRDLQDQGAVPRNQSEPIWIYYWHP